MELKKLLQGIEGIKAKGDVNVDVKNVTNDSRKVEKGGMFIAIKGFETDGHMFIKDVIKKEPGAIMVEEGANLKELASLENITILVVPDTRKALAIVSSNFYGNPSQKLKIIGVTGTKGKTTTTYMIKEILEKQGKKVGLIGTIAVYIAGKKLEDSSRTTPESIELQEILAKMVDAGVEYVIMEVSSQSLKLDRIYGLSFDIGIFTNFSEDHISDKEHPDMDDYYKSKLKLFDLCKTGFTNVDDLHGAKVAKIQNCDIKTYGIDNSANLLAKDITITNTYADFKVKLGERNERVKVGIPGRFSVYNALAAISVALKLGVDTETIKTALEVVRVPRKIRTCREHKRA